MLVWLAGRRTVTEFVGCCAFKLPGRRFMLGWGQLLANFNSVNLGELLGLWAVVQMNVVG